MRFGRNIKFIVYFHNIAVLVDCNFFSLEHLNSGKLSHIGTLNGGLKVIRIFPLQKADGAFWLYYWRFLSKFFHTGLIWDLVFEWKATMGLKMFRLIFPAVFGHLKKTLSMYRVSKVINFGPWNKISPPWFPHIFPAFFKKLCVMGNAFWSPEFSFPTQIWWLLKFWHPTWALQKVFKCLNMLEKFGRGGGVSPISLFNLEKVLAELKWLVGLKSKH